MKKSNKHPEEMTRAELNRATRHFDEPFTFEKARPMTPAERAEETKLRQTHRRHRNGRTARKISVSLEGELLAKTDALAKKRGVNRSELIASLVADGLRRMAI